MALNNITNAIASSPIIAGSAQNARETEKALKGNGASQAARTGALADDSVEITDQAKKLSTLQEKIKNAPDVDTARVQSIKNSVNNGSYKIDGRAIADKMVGLESDLAALYN